MKPFVFKHRSYLVLVVLAFQENLQNTLLPVGVRQALYSGPVCSRG